MLKKTGGGELKTKNEQGKIRSKDTIAPGNDAGDRSTQCMHAAFALPSIVY